MHTVLALHKRIWNFFNWTYFQMVTPIQSLFLMTNFHTKIKWMRRVDYGSSVTCVFVAKTGSEGQIDYWRFDLSEQNTFWCSFCLLHTLLVAVFLLNEELSILYVSACTVEYMKNGIFVSIVVRFLVYLAEKQAVKAKKSTKVSTWGQKVLSDVLSARCVQFIGHCFPAEQKFDWRKRIASGGNE